MSVVVSDWVIANEKSSTTRLLAVYWFSGKDPFELFNYSKATKAKYRRILLNYGIDLYAKSTEEMRKLMEESNPSKLSDFEFKSVPKLSVVKP